MPSAPLPADEPRRLTALLRCNVLDTEPESAFDDLTRLAAELCDTPIALVSLVDSHRQWFKSRVGLDAEETPREQAFCGYAILADEPLIIPDATADPRTADNPLVTGGPRIRFYAGVPLRLSNGQALGTLCVIDTQPRDISESVLDKLRALALQAASQLELRMKLHELEEAGAVVRRASEAKTIFLANMSHEIRTPMTAILGYADLLGTDPDMRSDPDQVTEAVDAIQRNGRHLLTVINDILDVSKIEAGKMSVEQVATDPMLLADDVAGLVRPAALAAGLDLRLVYDTPMPTSITTDPTRLRQILLNLLSNAVKFTKRGTVTFRGSCDSDAELLTFSVTDTGIGMTAQQRDRIARFEAFTQADASTTRTYGGTGLGLRISHSLADLLSGSLSIESEPGTGSTFTVTIPTGDLAGTDFRCDEDGRSECPGAPLPRASDRGGAPALAGCRILLAEDGPDNQRLITFHLQKSGADVSVAENGRIAVEMMEVAAAERPFDLVLMDVQMPELDGHAATRAIRHRGYVAPIIALTAHAMGDERQKCLDAGCDDYLTKPIDPAALITACREALGRPCPEQTRQRSA